jgi:hypothetical protein
MTVRTVLDPTAELVPSGIPKVDRPASLQGLRVGLLDITKPRGNVFLDRLQELVEAQGATVQRFAKPTFTKPAPADLRYEISTKCDVVIEALAD